MVAPERRRNPALFRTPRIVFYARKLDEAVKVLRRLKEKSAAGVPIVVEGRRDEQALRKLGVDGKILTLKARGESKPRFLDRLDGFRDVIVLTDFDREGGELRLWLCEELPRRGVQADDFVWNRIRSLARTEIRGVEELPSFLRATEARARGERP